MRKGCFLGCQVAIDLLRAEETGGLVLACTIAVGLGLGQHRLRLGNRSPGFRQRGFHGVIGNACQNLAFLNPVTHINPHLGQQEIADFRADDRLLPGGDIAIGR